MEKKLSTFVGFFFVCSILFVSGCVTERHPSPVIKLGFIGPLTGDGAFWGIIEKNAIDLAVEEMNANGGINGKKVLVQYEDGKCAGKDALTAARKLVEVEGVQILLVSCSQEIIPLASYTEPQRILVLSSYAMSSQISTIGDFVFRNAYSNRDYARVVAKTINDTSKTVAIVSEETEFAADLRDLFKKEFFMLGGKIVSDENIPAGEKLAGVYVTKMLAQNPEAIFLNPTGPATGIALLKELRQQRYTGKVYGNFFAGSKTVQATPDAQDVVFFADPEIPDGIRKAVFLEKYKKKFGQQPDLEYPAAARYDLMYVLKEAMKTAGENTTPIRDYFYVMKDFDGLLGKYHFDQNGDVSGIVPSVKVILSGKPYDFTATSQNFPVLDQ